MSKRTEAMAFLAQEAHVYHHSVAETCTAGLCQRLRELRTDAEKDDAASLALRRAVERVVIPNPRAKDGEIAPPAVRKMLEAALSNVAVDAVHQEHAALERDNALLRIALEFGGQCSIGRLLRLEAVLGAVDGLLVEALRMWPTAADIPDQLRARFTEVTASLGKMRQANEDPLQTIRTLAHTDSRITARFDLAARHHDAALRAIVDHAVKLVRECSRCGGKGTETRLVVVDGNHPEQLPCAQCGEWRELLDELRAPRETIAPDAPAKEGAP